MSISPNTTFAHYCIISKLGAGGMGEVYLAQDSKLDRKVAIKFLNEEFGKDTEKLKRFVLEAKSASALNHPNILTVYEIGETNGQNYIATELIEGKTLREQLQSKDSFSLNTILKVGVQVAEALSAAHQAGITHRDIKPENIMLRTDGYAKVLDFGLAKLATNRGEGATRGRRDAETRRNERADQDHEAKTIIAASPRPSVPASPLDDGSWFKTAPGIVMGTVSYMSPEQARGNPTDTRTDLWSLGVVLYEMIARKLPFSGETVNHTIVAILENEPRPLTTAPSELQRIIRKALTKDVDMRYQSARDLLIDLTNLRRDLDIQGELERSIVPSSDAASAIHENETQVYAGHAIAATKSGRVGTTSITASSSSLEYAVTQAKSHKFVTAIVFLALLAVISTAGYFVFVSRAGSRTQINSLAVMPFVNASGNSEIDYLTDGMTETLISSLSQIPNLNVKARSTVFYYKGKETTPKKIGEDLGVQAVLLGRVAQSGNDLKLTLELDNTTTQDVIWSAQYDRQKSDLITLQTEITRDISNKLKTKLSGEDVAKLSAVHTADPRAYELYLKGKYYSNQFTKQGLQIGVDSFNQAIATDPNYSRAYSGLAYTYILLDDWFMRPHESVAKARENATKAIAIDEADVDAHLVLALVAHWYDWDWKNSEDEFKRCLILNPKDSEGYTYYAYLLSSLRRDDEALRQAHEALKIDPLSSLANFGVAASLVFSRRYDEAIVHLQKAIKIDPNYWFFRSYLGRAYERKGMLSEAIVEFQHGVDIDNEQSENWAGLAHAYAVSGKKAEAEKIVNDLITKSTKGSYVSPYNIAIIYAGLDDKEKTLTWLERSYEERSYYLPVYLGTDERLDFLRADPHFKDLMRRLGLPDTT